MQQVQVVRAPQLDQIRPRLVVVSLSGHPLLLLITGKHEIIGELCAHEALMIIRSGIHQVTENLSSTPRITYGLRAIIRGNPFQTTRCTANRFLKIAKKFLITIFRHGPLTLIQSAPDRKESLFSGTRFRGGSFKLQMRRVLKLFSISVVALVVLTVTGVTGFIANRLSFYVQVARLYSQDPDRRLAMPLEDVSKRQIADTWGAPRGTGRRHEGQDIFAPKGTPVLSATSGFVYNIGENNLGGQTVSVIGAGGRVYYYAHLDKYAPGLEEGDRVTTHTVLGYVGTTGNAVGTPPHLHFGIYTASGAINPLPMLTDRNTPRVTNASSRRTQNRLRT